MIRIDLDSIRETGRSAQGVKAITLSDGDFVSYAAAIPSVEDIIEDASPSTPPVVNSDDI
jgi:DNA gyrase subunit A